MRQSDLSLLRSWCDRLISLQIHDTGVPQLDGGILCPACKIIHGRCPDAIFPLMRLADYTGDAKYRRAAQALFDWQTNLFCDDGSLYNDGNSAWNGITVFAAISLCEALTHHGQLLDGDTRKRWEDRLAAMGKWLYEQLDENFPSNINYPTTNAAAMALIGRYFGREDYLRQARHLADFACSFFTEEGFLRGEGKPRDGRTERGCYPIDIGYNVEESVPSLVKCALALKDEALLARLDGILLRQLNYFLPDGAWNNSFGSRNNKWTYWGSRTSDGCQGAYALMARRDARFAEAARRNTALLARCTHDGLLYGGPQYWENGELPCVHHTFCHANALAVALGADGYEDGPAAALPNDSGAVSLCHDADVDTWRASVGPWRASVTGYDFNISAGHATGGTLSLLWHEAAGPVLLSSVVDYRLVEPLNMQQTLKKSRHRPMTPRVELMMGKTRFSQCYDVHASIQAVQEPAGVRFAVAAQLVDAEQHPLPQSVFAALSYHILPDSVTIEGTVYGERAKDARLVLPVIPGAAQVTAVPACPQPEEIFFLTGGFAAREYVLAPDPQGRFSAVIRLG